MLTQEQQEILTLFGETIVDRLREDIRSKSVTRYGPVNASGDLANSIRFEADETGLRVYGLDYIYYLEFGRQPGKFPPRQPIIDWIQAKGISFDIPIESLAFLIQRKIATEGTTAWEQGGTDLVSGVINDELISEIQTAFSDDFIKTITSDIYEAYGIAA